MHHKVSAMVGALLGTLILSLVAVAQEAPEGVAREGDAWVFRDPLYGYSLLYADGLKIMDATEYRRRLEKLGHRPKWRSCEGPRFSLGSLDLRCDVSVPCLQGSVQWIDPRRGALTQEYLASQSHKYEGSRDDVLSLGDLEAVTVGESVFHRYDYQYPHPRSGKPVVERVYFHYDPVARLAYSFGLSSCRDHADHNFEVLEKVMTTVRLAKLRGPAPSEAPGIAG